MPACLLAEAMARIKTDGVLEFGDDTAAVMAQARAIFQAGRASDDEIESKGGGETGGGLGKTGARSGRYM